MNSDVDTGVHTSCFKEDSMKIGDYIVIQRQKYSKIHKISNKLLVMLGNNQLELNNIIGRPFFTTFRMTPKEKKRNVFVLEECSKAKSFAERLIKDVASGTDNRNIVSDGNSQKLSKEEIVSLRDKGMSGCDIVSQLLENSTTFQEKTEYSQEKYLTKKEKKYFDYVLIRKPTLRLVSDIIYKQDPMKIMGLRCDSLSQLISSVGVSSGGTYIVYESSCEGLPTAALLSYIGDSGYLVHTFPGLTPHRQAILAMNFSEVQKKRLISVSIQSLIQTLNNKVTAKDTLNPAQAVINGEKSGSLAHTNVKVEECTGSNSDKVAPTEDRTSEAEVSPSSEMQQIAEDMEISKCESVADQQLLQVKDDKITNLDYTTRTGGSTGTVDEETTGEERKRKFATSELNDAKKPRWEMDLDRAVDLLSPKNIDGLLVVGREDPADIVFTLLPYLAPSRNFAVYSWCREPLIELYLKLKKVGGTINIHLTESFFRTHQVLPNRTHPDIQMSGCGGYLLTGTVVLLQSPIE